MKPEQDILRLFQVDDGKQMHFFDQKMAAKDKRDDLKSKGHKNVKVSKGPDHDHYTKEKYGWNKGRHPKHGKNQSANGGKPGGRGRLSGR